MDRTVAIKPDPMLTVMGQFGITNLKPVTNNNCNPLSWITNSTQTKTDLWSLTQGCQHQQSANEHSIHELLQWTSQPGFLQWRSRTENTCTHFKKGTAIVFITVHSSILRNDPAEHHINVQLEWNPLQTSFFNRSGPQRVGRWSLLPLLMLWYQVTNQDLPRPRVLFKNIKKI